MLCFNIYVTILTLSFVSMTTCLTNFFLRFLENLDASKGYNKAASPFGVISPLSTLALASSSTTRKEILKVIGVKNKEQLKSYSKDIIKKLDKIHDMEINIDTKIIINHNQVYQEFNNSADDLFDVQIINGTLNSEEFVKVINLMVKDNTHNYLEENVISSASSLHDTRFLVLTSIFIRAPWKTPFKSVDDGHFGDHLTRSYMEVTGNFQYSYSDRLKAELVSIPFQDARCSLVVVLAESNSAINNKKQIYNASRYFTSTYMTLKIPKVSMEAKIDPRAVLKGMGIESLFSKDEMFENMFDPKQNRKPKIKSWQIFQTSVFNLNEDGLNFKNSHKRTRNEPLETRSNPKILNLNKPFSFEVGCFDITLLSGFVYRP